MRYHVKLTAIRDLEKQTKLVMTIAHIYKMSNQEALKRISNLPLTLLKNAREGQADKMLKIFRSLGADVILEEVPETEQQTKSGPVISAVASTVPSKSSVDFKMSFSTIAVIGIVATTALGLGGWFFWDQFQPKTTQAERLIKQGRFEEAHEYLKKNIATGTGTAGDYIQQAMVLIMMARQEQDSLSWNDFGQYGHDQMPKWGEDLLKTPKANRALNLIRMGVERYPENPDLNRWEGFILQTKGLYDEAEVAYSQAVQKDPQNAIYRNLLGTLNKDQGLYDKSDYQFRSILAFDSNNADALDNLSVLNLAHRKDTLLAMEYFRRNTSPKDPSRYALRKEMAQAAFLKFNQKSYPEARNSLLPYRYYESKRKELQGKKLSDPQASVELADLYGQKGMIRAAIDELNEARREGVESPDLYAHLAQAYIAQEKPESALHILKEADSKDEVNVEIYKNLALLTRYYSEDVNQANKYLKSYLELGGDQHQQQVYESVIYKAP